MSKKPRRERESELDERAETRAEINNAFNDVLVTADNNIKKKMDDTVRASLFEDIETPAGCLPMTPKMEQVAIAMARGAKTYSEIARKSGLHAATISKWAKRPDFRKWVRAIQIHLGVLTVDEEFKKLLPRAIEVTREIMLSDDVTPSTRLDAATRIVDRVMGKAAQPVEHRGGLLKQVISQIDAEKEADFAQTLEGLEIPDDSETVN